MNIFKSHFRYNKRQRNGIFFLLFVILFLQAIFFFVDFSSNNTINYSNKEFQNFQKELDSLTKIKLQKQQPNIFPFNPNFITDFKGYQLGMSIIEIDKLLQFRAKGLYINSANQFQKVTGVSDSLLNVISPYFKFPEWVNSKKEQSFFSKKNESNSIKIRDINKATVSDFKAINGIGNQIATRIVNYRTKLQGFSTKNQLYEVWNLDSLLVKEIIKNFEIIDIPKIQKININKATFKEILSVVYIDYELTKKIFNYRDEVAEIQSIDELKKIEGFPLDKFDRIALYLVAE
jgi:DNA uptake protein ComE-like DNA-binding protein